MHAVQCDVVPRLAGKARSRHQRAGFPFDKKDAARRDEDDMPGLARERHLPRRAGKHAALKLDGIGRADRGHGQGAARRGDAALLQKPARQQRLRQRRRDRPGAGGLQYAEAVAHVRAAAAQFLADPGEREAALLQRLPERRRPDAVFGIVDRLGRAEVREDALGRVEDDPVAHLRPSSRATMPFSTSLVPPRMVEEGTWSTPSASTLP